MAHQIVTLQTAWFTRASNQLLWRPAAGQRIPLDDALKPSAASTINRFISNVLLRKGAGSVSSPHIARMDLTDSQSGGFGGGTGSDLSPDFEAEGKIGVTYKTHSWVLPDDVVGDDTAEPYIWNLIGTQPGDPGRLLSDFIDDVVDGEAAVSAELIIWDGQGTNPFAAPAVTVTVADPTVDGAAPTNGDTVIFTAGAVGGTATGAIAYQWQSLSGSSWSNIAGETAATYDRTEASAGTVTVRVVVTRGGVSATSGQVSATWSAAPGPPPSTSEIYSLVLVKYAGSPISGQGFWSAPLDIDRLKGGSPASPVLQLTSTYLPSDDPAFAILAMELQIGTGSGNLFVSGPTQQDLTDELEMATLEIQHATSGIVLWSGVLSADAEDHEPYDLEASEDEVLLVTQQPGNLKLVWKSATTGTGVRKLRLGADEVVAAKLGGADVTRVYLGDTLVLS